MNFLSYEDLVQDSTRLARMLPVDVIGVLGVARSGMLPATIIAQELGCHLGEVESFVATGGAFFRPGRRMTYRGAEGMILVVDDSLHGGSALAGAMASLQRNPLLLESMGVMYGAIYVEPGKEELLDFHARVVSSPRLFAWNWLHSEKIETALCDLDGLICADPTTPDDDGPEYATELASLAPLHVPTRRVGGIVTGRIERWRDVTMDWLIDNGVTCGDLKMAPFTSAAERNAFGAARWKAEVYKASEAPLFIESKPEDAATIAELSGKPVLCPAAGRCFQ